MKFYCGIDLSARDCHVCVIDEQLKIVIEQKLRNELPRICQLLEPAWLFGAVHSRAELSLRYLSWLGSHHATVATCKTKPA